MYTRATELNRTNILGLLNTNPQVRLLDLGCDNGDFTSLLMKKLGVEKAEGLEINADCFLSCKQKNISVTLHNLNKATDFPNNSFDLIHANQVIEHLTDTDLFLSEMKRILKPKGELIISTENASSWCNIFASIFGWQIFSLTNFSNVKSTIGNPLALNEGCHVSTFWRHIRILNYRGLKDYFINFGFSIHDIKGAGYFPLPCRLGNWDKRHAHFLTFKLQK